jgi:hypothetical protein
MLGSTLQADPVQLREAQITVHCGARRYVAWNLLLAHRAHRIAAIRLIRTSS